MKTALKGSTAFATLALLAAGLCPVAPASEPWPAWDVPEACVAEKTGECAKRSEAESFEDYCARILAAKAAGNPGYQFAHCSSPMSFDTRFLKPVKVNNRTILTTIASDPTGVKTTPATIGPMSRAPGGRQYTPDEELALGLHRMEARLLMGTVQAVTAVTHAPGLIARHLEGPDPCGRPRVPEYVDKILAVDLDWGQAPFDLIDMTAAIGVGKHSASRALTGRLAGKALPRNLQQAKLHKERFRGAKVSSEAFAPAFEALQRIYAQKTKAQVSIAAIELAKNFHRLSPEDQASALAALFRNFDKLNKMGLLNDASGLAVKAQINQIASQVSATSTSEQPASRPVPTLNESFQTGATAFKSIADRAKGSLRRKLAAATVGASLALTGPTLAVEQANRSRVEATLTEVGFRQAAKVAREATPKVAKANQQEIKALQTAADQIRSNVMKTSQGSSATGKAEPARDPAVTKFIQQNKIDAAEATGLINHLAIQRGFSAAEALSFLERTLCRCDNTYAFCKKHSTATGSAIPATDPVLLVLLSGLVPSAWAQAEAVGANCLQSATLALRAPIDESDRDLYHVHVPGENLYAHVELEDRVLYFNFKMRGDHGERHPQMRGSDHFEAALRHFKGRYKKIAGVWEAGDNLNALNELTAPPSSLSLEEAARKTWTGQQAMKIGFTEVRVLEAEGTPGRFDQVVVTFEKPQTARKSAKHRTSAESAAPTLQ